MKGVIFYLFLFLLVLSCGQQEAGLEMGGNSDSKEGQDRADSFDLGKKVLPGKAGNWITPGKSIGLVKLGDPADQLVSKLGKPDLSDAAMGKAWLTWFNKKRDEHNNRNEFNIYLTYSDTNMSARTVRQIRTTSPEHFTVNDIRVYSGLPKILESFPSMKFQSRHIERSNGKRVINIYDDIVQGIAVEIVDAGNEKICIGIIVHPPGETVTDIYGFLRLNTGE